jgi:hypothetical protein
MSRERDFIEILTVIRNNQKISLTGKSKFINPKDISLEYFPTSLNEESLGLLRLALADFAPESRGSTTSISIEDSDLVTFYVRDIQEIVQEKEILRSCILAGDTTCCSNPSSKFKVLKGTPYLEDNCKNLLMMDRSMNMKIVPSNLNILLFMMTTILMFLIVLVFVSYKSRNDSEINEGLIIPIDIETTIKKTKRQRDRRARREAMLLPPIAGGNLKLDSIDEDEEENI